jgi:hypothetical protein
MSWPDTIFKWLAYGEYNLTLPTTTTGNPQRLQCDKNGRLLIAKQSDTSYVRSTSLENSHVVKTSAGTLYELHGFNDGSVTLYLMLFNTTSVPANGTAPLERFRIPAGGSIAYSPGQPISLGTGIVWAASTTPNTLTIDTASKSYVSVAYQ